MALIELKNVNLTYPMMHSSQLNLFKKNESKMERGYHSLRDVNLTIKEGDRLGLIGRNGAGKSTLLKLLAGVYKPDSGSIKQIGSTASLIDPNLGLDNKFSGIQNIKTIGLLMGLLPELIESKIPEIEAFTELGDFLYEPVST